MNDQNQNIQPDYGFILNQGSQEPQKKPNNKRVIILLVLSGVLIVSLLVIVLVNRTSKMVSEDEQIYSSETAEGEEKAKEFLGLISESKYDQAYESIVSTKKSDQHKEHFIGSDAPFIYERVDLSKCINKSLTTDAQAQTTDIIFSCPMKQDERSILIRISILAEDELTVLDYETLGEDV